MKYKQGDFTVFKLTGQTVMILDILEYPVTSTNAVDEYFVRFPDKTAIKVAWFELMDRKGENE